MIFRWWYGYAQSHASGYLWGASYVFIIWYLIGLDWWGMYCICSINGLVFGSTSWLSILQITEHSWFLDEGIFFILGMDCCCCAEVIVRLYPGDILKVPTLSLGTCVTLLVNSCLSTFHERMMSSATVDSIMCWLLWDCAHCCGMSIMHLPDGTQ